MVRKLCARVIKYRSEKLDGLIAMNKDDARANYLEQVSKDVRTTIHRLQISRLFCRFRANVGFENRANRKPWHHGVKPKADPFNRSEAFIFVDKSCAVETFAVVPEIPEQRFEPRGRIEPDQEHATRDGGTAAHKRSLMGRPHQCGKVHPKSCETWHRECGPPANGSVQAPKDAATPLPMGRMEPMVRATLIVGSKCRQLPDMCTRHSDPPFLSRRPSASLSAPPETHYLTYRL